MSLGNIYEKESENYKKSILELFKKNPSMLDALTEYSDDQIQAFTQLELDDQICKDVFGIDLNLTKLISIPLKHKLISKGRSGRIEASDMFKHELEVIDKKRGLGSQMIGV